MPAKFFLFKDKAKKYRFNLKASNGEIIASSEAYNTKAAALNGIKSIQKNAAAAKIDDPEAIAEAAAKKEAEKKKAEAKKAVKKPAAKKTAAKKPAAKKSAAKKPAKKPAAPASSGPLF
jgi:uncharacterized protein YegP (UPF0339 family)